MKKFSYFLVPIVLFSVSSCGDQGKTADDIEQEYSKKQETYNNSEQLTEGLDEHAQSESTPLEQFEYLEDFATIKTKSKLYEIFGSENLSDGSQWFAEGTVEFQTTTLTDPNTLNVYVYNWSQDDNETLDFIEGAAIIWDENYEVARRQVIMSKEGIFTGMSLKDLHAWNNNEDFIFFGFGWDYEGGIALEKGTKLGDTKVQIKLALDDYQDPNNSHLLGDLELNTADEGMLQSPIIVDRLTIYVNTESSDI
ncbi:MAG: hypothetical protein H6598_03205 [Flavobacteriales bacterium]|nr:hypothetical protein [Flavobacteriales bacterium]